MSDLEDIDPGAEDLHLEEELPAPPGEHPEERFEPPKSSGGAVLKIVIVAVLLAAAGGAWFVMKSSRRPASLAARIPAQALPVPPLPTAAKKAGADALADWNNSVPSTATAPAGTNSSSAAANTPPVPPSVSAAASLPAAIAAAPSANIVAAAPAMPVPAPLAVPPAAPASVTGVPSAITPPVPASATATAPAVPAKVITAASAMPAAISAMPPTAPVVPPAGLSSAPSALSPTPPIVNDQPPSAALLTSTQNTVPAVKPNMPSPVSPIPDSPFEAPVPATAGTNPVQAPAENPAATANAGADTSTLSPSSKGLQIKNGEAMPSAIVPPVDKTEMDQAETDKAEAAKTKVSSPPVGELSAEEAGRTPRAEESAKVEELQKKIDELEKTISQLQQTPVTKEEADKSAATEEMALPKASHKKLASRRRRPPAKTRHVAASVWVLKAAKPGVAWITRKGYDDLKMVEVGDSLTGVGRVTAIVKSSSGNWVVNGTRGRISE